MKFYLTKNSSNALKITAALIVMLHHYAQYVCANGFSDSIIYKILSSQAGFFGVAVFFLLSGYGLMESESKTHLGFLLFLKKRVLKVYMPVICVTLLWMIVSPIFLNSSPFNGLPIEIGGVTR